MLLEVAADIHGHTYLSGYGSGLDGFCTVGVPNKLVPFVSVGRASPSKSNPPEPNVACGAGAEEPKTEEPNDGRCCGAI